MFCSKTTAIALISGLDPEGSFTGGGGGGALQAKDLNPAAQAVSGVRKPLLIGGGVRG